VSVNDTLAWQSVPPGLHPSLTVQIGDLENLPLTDAFLAS
jgi:hypothetical protein